MRTRLTEIKAADAYIKFYSDKLTLPEYKKLVSLDPTYKEDRSFEKNNKGPYVDWILKQFFAMDDRNKKMTVTEDAEQIKEGLKIYHKFKRNNQGVSALSDILEINREDVKDINKLTFTEIRFLYNHADSLEGQDVALEKRVNVIYNGERIFALEPLTHEASRKYGTGTNWCTAVSNSNWYDSYNKKHEGLIIIIMKEDQRIKYQTTKDGYTMTDYKNKEISPRHFLNEVASKGEVYKNEVDEIAEIFGTKIKIKGWTIEELTWNPAQLQIAEMLKKIPYQDIPYYVTNHGWSLLGYLIKEDQLELAEFIHEQYKANLIHSDLYLILFASNYWGRSPLTNEERGRIFGRLLGYLDGNLLFESIRYMIEKSEASHNHASFFAENMPLRYVRDLFIKMAEELSIEKRFSLIATSSRRGLFKKEFFRTLYEEESQNDLDKISFEIVTTYFPELLEDSRDADAPSLQEAYYFSPEIEAKRKQVQKDLISMLRKKKDAESDVFEQIKKALLYNLREAEGFFPSLVKLLKGEGSEEIDFLGITSNLINSDSPENISYELQALLEKIFGKRYFHPRESKFAKFLFGKIEETVNERFDELPLEDMERNIVNYGTNLIEKINARRVGDGNARGEMAKYFVWKSYKPEEYVKYYNHALKYWIDGASSDKVEIRVTPAGVDISQGTDGYCRLMARALKKLDIEERILNMLDEKVQYLINFFERLNIMYGNLLEGLEEEKKEGGEVDWRKTRRFLPYAIKDVVDLSRTPQHFKRLFLSKNLQNVDNGGLLRNMDVKPGSLITSTKFSGDFFSYTWAMNKETILVRERSVPLVRNVEVLIKDNPASKIIEEGEKLLNILSKINEIYELSVGYGHTYSVRTFAATILNEIKAGRGILF